MMLRVAFVLGVLVTLSLGKQVLTPQGYRPAECVLTVPSGSTFRETDTGVEITHVDGSIEHHVPAQACHEDDILTKYAKSRSAVSPADKVDADPFPEINGWLDYAGWYPPYTSGESNLQRFISNYTVPGNPPLDSDQVLFYFIGMQDNDASAVNIIQPVLTWGNGMDGWNAASWACCPKNITVQSTTMVGFQAGDVLGAMIDRVSPSTWRITTSWKGQETTLMAQVGDYQYNWADITLEVYTVQTCNEFATGPATFTNLAMWDKDGMLLTPDWTLTGSTQCQGSITLTKDGAVIQHTPQ